MSFNVIILVIVLILFVSCHRKVTVSPVPIGEFPEERGANSVRDIRIKATDGTTSFFVEILPATNGWFSTKK